MTRRYWSDAELDEVLRLYADGCTQACIAARYRQPWERIRDRLRDRRPTAWAAASRPGARRVWVDADLDEAVRLLEAGRTRSQVGVWLGCTESALTSALRRYRPKAWRRVRFYGRE